MLRPVFRKALRLSLLATMLYFSALSPALAGPPAAPDLGVLFGWTNTDKGEIAITWKPQGDEQAHIDALARRHEGHDPLLHTADAGLPQRARNIGPQRLMTTRGIFLSDHKGFRVANPGDGARLRIIFVMPPALKDAEHMEVLSLPLRMRPKEAMREATVRPLARQLGAALLPTLRAKLDGDAKTRLSDEAISIAPGNFPEPHAFLVLMRESGSYVNSKGHEDRLTGLTLAQARGPLSGVLFPPQLRGDFYSIDFLVDIDGDTYDEVLLRAIHQEGPHESQSFYLLRWSKAQPELMPLYGSGI